MAKLYKGNYLNGEIEIIDSVEVFQNQFIEIYNDKVRFPRGNYGSYIRINNPEPYSVAVLPLIDENTAVLIKTFRHGVRGWGYEVPKGGIKKGETSEEAALRELLEETGYITNKLIYLGEYSESPAIFSGLMNYYIASDCIKSEDVNCEETEAIAGICKFDIEAFFNRANKLDFKDAVTEFMILKYLQMKRG